MRNRIISLLCAPTLALLFAPLFPAFSGEWQLALPGYRYQFPRDHFSHPDYETEWWYYTGNLRDAAGHRFGFELTFFRQALQLPERVATVSSATWRPDQVYLAHLALSDIDGHDFYYTERLNRPGPGLAGVDFGQRRYWNGNWQVHWLSLAQGTQRLQAVSERLALDLDLTPEKPFVIHGKDGISQKASGMGKASHYISFTRLSASGNLQWKGATFSLNGLAWMDHEFFTEQLDSSERGWDWFAIQLQNDQELMLYRLRKKSGQADLYSSGTYVDAAGHAHFLDSSQFQLTPVSTWQSSKSGARYPVAWKISVPSLQLDVTEQTLLNSQELFSKDPAFPIYWEGAVIYSGTMHSAPVNGVGYLEMTGYQKALNLGGN